MVSFLAYVLYLCLTPYVHAYWRMNCGIIQTGRVDPVVSFGSVSGHVHKLSGASTIGLSSTYDSLQDSRCTSCEVVKDLSAYWTPQLYYQHANGSFQEVPNSGTVVYYLGRGDNRLNVEPFPEGFKMLSGNTNKRSYDSETLTYLNGRPVADRVSFACLSSTGPMAETANMKYTDCDDGLRAQVQFQSCWDGQNLYLDDNSHVEYMSQIDNGVCPPTHPVQLIHLFYEVYYGVNDVDKSDGGQFVFANGDTTGYGFHGDFINGWDNTTLVDGLAQCANNDSITNPSACPAFQVDEYFSTNCPEQPPIVNEAVHGWLDSLPGCNPITSGPEDAIPVSNCNNTAMLNNVTADTATTMLDPEPGYLLGTWSYLGCANEPSSGRALSSSEYDNSTGMTIESCVSYCDSLSLPLAGLEYSSQCFCGTTLSSTIQNSSVCDSTQKMLCSGNSSEYCGGPNLLTVWNNTAWVNPQPTIGQSTILSGSAVYAGCYSEATGIRALSKASTSGSNSSIMSNELCGQFCMGMGYSLFGMEWSQECFCGNYLESGSVKEAETDCNMQCSGDGKELCGAGNRLSVWNATKIAATSSVVSSSSSSVTSSAASATATAPTCPGSNSTIYTDTNGAQYLIECGIDHAGGDMPSPNGQTAHNLTQCIQQCSARNGCVDVSLSGTACYLKQTVGSVVFDGVYGAKLLVASKSSASSSSSSSTPASTSPTSVPTLSSLESSTTSSPTASSSALIIPAVTSLPLPYNYSGCYTNADTSSPVLFSNATSFTNTTSMTVEQCSYFCAQNSTMASNAYTWMAIQDGDTCSCNNEIPNISSTGTGNTLVSNSNCNVACSGNSTEACGGLQTVSLYELIQQ